MTKNQALRRMMLATAKPGVFALGSMQSRAAARALLTAKIDSAPHLDFVVSIIGKPKIFNPPSIGKWRESADGTMTRISRIPWGMSIEQAERMANA